MTICGLIASYGDPDGGDARAALMQRGEPVFRERGVTACEGQLVSRRRIRLH